jgi:hypothetical protein
LGKRDPKARLWLVGDIPLSFEKVIEVPESQTVAVQKNHLVVILRVNTGGDSILPTP